MADGDDWSVIELVTLYAALIAVLIVAYMCSDWSL